MDPVLVPYYLVSCDSCVQGTAVFKNFQVTTYKANEQQNQLKYILFLFTKFSGRTNMKGSK
jgi:hypothetical protein